MQYPLKPLFTGRAPKPQQQGWRREYRHALLVVLTLKSLDQSSQRHHNGTRPPVTLAVSFVY